MKKFIKMNVELAGFSQGQKWLYDKAPDVVKMWLEKKSILFETRICSLVTKDGKPVSTESIKIETPKSDSLAHLDDATRKLYSVCKGVKNDGTPCKSHMLIEGTQYCRHHQHQAG